MCCMVVLLSLDNYSPDTFLLVLKPQSIIEEDDVKPSAGCGMPKDWRSIHGPSQVPGGSF